MARDCGKGTLKTGRREEITNRHKNTLEKSKYFAAFLMALLSNRLECAKVHRFVHFTHCVLSVPPCSAETHSRLGVLIHKWCEADLSYYCAN